MLEGSQLSLPPSRMDTVRLLVTTALCVLAIECLLTFGQACAGGGGAALKSDPATNTTPAAPSLTVPSADDANLPAMQTAEAVMVTVELDFGATPPGIADALRQIERRYQPADGVGRTFAILDAYGEPTPDNKLHISMHVSAEKPGLGALVFRRTGATLWKTRIVPAAHPPASSFAGKNLLIMVADERGKPYLLDGSKVSSSIMDATVRDLSLPLRDFWPDGEEREATFFYSACGCPVKVMVRRVGNVSIRTKDLPVIFPDDLAVAATIARLMGWK
jgi:hypothetical protein